MKSFKTIAKIPAPDESPDKYLRRFALALSRQLGPEDPEGLEILEAQLQKTVPEGVPTPQILDEAQALAAIETWLVTPAKHRSPPEMPLPLLRFGPDEDWIWDPRHSPKNFVLDFLDGPLGYRIARAESDSSPLRKALPKARDTTNKIVWDLCGGYRVDALLMAHWRFDVISWEKSPWVHLFGARALERSKLVIEKELTLKLRDTDGLEALETQALLGTMAPSIVYIDPMYPETGGSALNQAEMRYLHSLAATEDLAKPMLELSLKVALDRVILKRPVRAPEAALNPPRSPEWKVEQGSTRYDIYLTQR